MNRGHIYLEGVRLKHYYCMYVEQDKNKIRKQFWNNLKNIYWESGGK